MTVATKELPRTFTEIENEIYNVLTIDPEICDVNEETGEIIEPDDEDVLGYLSMLAEMEEEKADGIAFQMKKAEAYAEFLKAEEKHIAKKRAAVETRLERFKAYIKAIMKFNNLKKVSGKVHTLALRRSEAVVLSVDDKELPSGFVLKTIVFKADKRLIKEAISAGKRVKGAAIEERYSLNIR